MNDEDTNESTDDVDEHMALLCSIYACDRACNEQTIDLPRPGTPECSAIFLSTWEAFQHVTTELGKLRMIELGKRVSGYEQEAFVHGRQTPAYIRWAETEAMIRAGEWSPDESSVEQQS